MADFASILPEPVRQAIAVLCAAGFRAFTEVKFEDVRELDSGRRMRTFRHSRRRWELVLAAERIEDLEHAQPMAPEPAPDADDPDGGTGGGENPDASQPVADMNVAELRAEAKKYPEITGEYKMLKSDLQGAIAGARRRRALLLKKITLE